MTTAIPVCLTCRWYKGIGPDGAKCEAFPKKGIPDEIWSAENDHSKPVKGDHGLQYEEGDVSLGYDPDES